MRERCCAQVHAGTHAEYRAHRQAYDRKWYAANKQYCLSKARRWLVKHPPSRELRDWYIADCLKSPTRQLPEPMIRAKRAQLIVHRITRRRRT